MSPGEAVRRAGRNGDHICTGEDVYPKHGSPHKNASPTNSGSEKQKKERGEKKRKRERGLLDWISENSSKIYFTCSRSFHGVKYPVLSYTVPGNLSGPGSAAPWSLDHSSAPHSALLQRTATEEEVQQEEIRLVFNNG